MQVIRFLLLTMSLSLVAPSLPVFAQDSAISTETGLDQVEVDAAIATRIRNILAELDAFQDVTVAVNEGIVTLRGTTLSTEGHEELQQLVERVEGVIAIENEVTISTDIAERLDPAMERIIERVKQFGAFLPLFVISALAFAAVVALGFLLARMRQPWARLAPNAFIADIYRTIIRLASVIAGVVVALDILGATALLSTVLGAAGIIGLALGFAVRDTVENFIASLLLSIRQPFRPNDTIEIAGDVGKVIRLTSRATILLSFDGNHIRIPNSTVFKSRIINYTRNRERRFAFNVSLTEKTDLNGALAKALGRLNELGFVLKAPAPAGWIESVTNDGAVLSFTAWINQQETSLSTARGEAMRQVQLLLTEHGALEEESIGEMKAADEDALDKLVAQDRDANQQSDLLDEESAEE